MYHVVALQPLCVSAHIAVCLLQGANVHHSQRRAGLKMVELRLLDMLLVSILCHAWCGI